MVADDLNKKVKARIDDLIAKPEQLKFKMDLQDGILGEPWVYAKLWMYYDK